ncbi:DUF2076 domain-containing protein [Motilimonas eburnea]|uniref:DUF2076 domain-containing protein n=1 Tax=Motilimonas eburnea TaxID=1737488 RepID=UPI001E3621C6|nr:DUF2076 domain-containing protein [Motilimonas eburnea]MCE2573585.1 DUF2076 domain-containing protein [Motilimonas eburnea]
MSIDQASAIIALADRVRHERQMDVDLETAQLVQHLFAHKPHALYHLVQHNLALQDELRRTRQQNVELQQLAQVTSTVSSGWLTWLERKLMSNQVASSSKNDQ